MTGALAALVVLALLAAAHTTHHKKETPMPRRNYRPGARLRRSAPGDEALQHLAQHRPPEPEPINACTECGKSLPAGWRYPEHARCFNGRKPA